MPKLNDIYFFIRSDAKARRIPFNLSQLDFLDRTRHLDPNKRYELKRSINTQGQDGYEIGGADFISDAELGRVPWSHIQK